MEATPWVGLAMLGLVVMVIGAAMIFYLAPWMVGGVRALPSPLNPATVEAAPTVPTPEQPVTVWRLPPSTQHVAPPTTTGVVPDVTCSTN